jgi:hypothetical protein
MGKGCSRQCRGKWLRSTKKARSRSDPLIAQRAEFEKASDMLNFIKREKRERREEKRREESLM